MSASIAELRKEYSTTPLDRAHLYDDPFALFEQWFDDARRAAVPEPNAMTLATVSADGRPSARVVLLKGVNDRGFTFFTNFESRKGRDLDDTGRAALVFWWQEIERQVRAEGTVERVSDAEADAYFASRPRDSRIGAWASPQSRPIVNRAVLERNWAALKAQFDGRDVPRPPHWGGYRLLPEAVEFWKGRAGRLHDRFLYTRAEDGGWRVQRLAP